MIRSLPEGFDYTVLMGKNQQRRRMVAALIWPFFEI
jgi:hypothetical protein